MDEQSLFISNIQQGYNFKKDSFILGAAMLEGLPLKNAQVKIPLKTLNRHGLIAGATGTGKTKTLQIIVENLSLKGIPSLVMDLKGDLSGLAQPGINNQHIEKRHRAIGISYEPKGFPLELLTLSDEKGCRLRATVSEFGPVLLSKILGLNDTQGGILALIFKYCDDHKLPLIDLKDLIRMLQYMQNEGKEDIKKSYGQVSSSSTSTIMRKIIELEQQGAEQFFGEISFDVHDLLRKDNDGNGIVSIMRLCDIQNKPKLFSTFMLSLLAEVFNTFPEVGDLDQPKLCIFIDEAHLIFKEANEALLDQIEMVIKLIRSKGVGIFFCTQNPTDIPDVVLSQLGLKVQHALRAFTARDRKNIIKTAENYPVSPFYQTNQILTELGIGEALITALNEKGIPTPLAATYMRAPMSRMDILNPNEIDQIIEQSDIMAKYNQEINRESAYEMLEEKMKDTFGEERQREMEEEKKRAAQASGKEASIWGSLSKNTMVRQLGRTFLRELTRGLLGTMGVKTTTRRRSYTRRRRYR